MPTIRVISLANRALQDGRVATQGVVQHQGDIF